MNKFEINFGFPNSKTAGEGVDNMFAMYQMCIAQIFRTLGFTPEINDSDGEKVSVLWSNYDRGVQIHTIVHLTLEESLTIDCIAEQSAGLLKKEGHGIMKEFSEVQVLEGADIPDFATFLIKSIKEIDSVVGIGLPMTTNVFAIIPRPVNIFVESGEVQDVNPITCFIPIIQCVEVSIFEDILIRINLQGGGLVHNDDGSIFGVDKSDILVYALGLIGVEAEKIAPSENDDAFIGSSKKHILGSLRHLEMTYSDELTTSFMDDCSLTALDNGGY